ncbi:tyrosine-type recombinase/integrase [Herbaspirillum rubrisubalbicans]|uniref:tyrosine-type recombinase/integrase n=1 Tax=Herbaspirillum rubrisubalbicans TaxID=80842 RepID=UPI000DD346E0|nr:tyrosine-type recombinase/integrase [Herbaspirillum rubrisubalbicans]
MAALPDGVYTRSGSNIYWLRIGIPKDLRDTFPLNQSGKPPVDAYRKSLGTSDKEVARAKALVILADHAADFTKRRLSKLAATNPPKQPMSEALADHLAALATWEILAFDDLSRLNLPELVPPLQFFSDQPPHNSTLIHRHAQGSDAIAREMLLNAAAGSFEEALEFAQRSCKQLGISIDWEAGQTSLSLMRIQRALAAAWMQAGARSRGDLIETPRKPVFASGAAETPYVTPGQPQAAPVAPAASGKTLSDVVPLWQDLRPRTPRAIKMMHKSIRFFVEATGSEALSSLKKADGPAFSRFLSNKAERGFGTKTGTHYASNITALLNIAEEEDWLSRNFVVFKIDVSRDAEERDAWTDEELATIASAPQFSDDLTNVKTWSNVAPVDGRTAMAILMHTGARIGEIAQLRCQDFCIKNNIRVIEITKEAGNLKTKQSARTVPLAQHLLDTPWFADWLAKLPPTGPAFPTLHGRQTVTPGDALGRWFRGLRESIGLPEGKLEASHKFRHWISSKLSAVGADTDQSNFITGHSTGGTKSKVYIHRDLQAMKDALDRLSYPDISGLKK